MNKVERRGLALLSHLAGPTETKFHEPDCNSMEPFDRKEQRKDHAWLKVEDRVHLAGWQEAT